MPERPKFLVSYRGLVEYEVDGHKYEVRYWGYDDGHYNTGVWDTHIKPSIGTVRQLSYDTNGNWVRDRVHTFPPAEVVALFPGFVGARYVPETWATEYDGAAPELIPDPDVPSYVTSRAVAEAKREEDRQRAIRVAQKMGVPVDEVIDLGGEGG